NRQKLVLLVLSSAVLATRAPVHAYEIDNHADVPDTAIVRSVLGTDIGPAGKLARLGLGNLQPNSDKQTFPLKQIHPFGPALGSIPYCFGSTRPTPPNWKITIPFSDPIYPSGQKDGEDVLQPFPRDATTLPKLTIAQMIRYGACYEDDEEPKARSLTHFFNPQDGGAALTGAGIVPAGPSSLRWMLQRKY
ncbi:MAG TPA: hypothetical protein PKN64_16380, partial [Casimicrobium sp.]|nr:hypothetical protein [Casimicrobium sp.]